MNAKDAVTKLTQRSVPEEGPGEDDQGEPEHQAEDVDPLPLDAVFELLKNKRRRYTIQYLQEQDGEVTLSDLAEHVAAIENDTTPRALSSDQRKRAYVGLYQCHLPKMDEMSAVKFNRDRGKIELGPNAQQLEPYLELDEEEQSRDWASYYLGVSALGIGLLGAGLALGPTLGGATELFCGLAVLAFSTVAVAHYRATRPEQ